MARPTTHDPSLIETALERGIISRPQADAMRALLDESQRPRTAGVEVARGFNAVTVAYVVGAMLVAFAFGWFLIDRWNALGPWGVLVVVGVYIALLLSCNVWLARRGFRLAAGIALTLAVALTPVLTWAVLAITGAWPLNDRGEPFEPVSRVAAARWLLVDLTALIAAGAALRRRPHIALTIPGTVALWSFWMHGVKTITGTWMYPALDRWLFLAGGLAVCAVAGDVDRWQVRTRSAGRDVDGDYAFFPWLGGLFSFAVAYLAIWARAGEWRHLMPVVGLVLIVLSMLLQRRTHLVFGLLATFGYLVFLATEVFKSYLSLPVILGTGGILLILVTVWAQRRYPLLVARVNAAREGQSLPPLVTRAPFLLALGLALLTIPDAADERAQAAFREQFYKLRRHNDSLRAASGDKPTPMGVGADSSALRKDTAARGTPH